ncbi:superoxide dismutase [Cronobacter dublinensis]|uniref:superoxide dismutase n=1 Tax=Cronobacter dublinensis TaxID=413497 RepID=UPI0013754E95|nr:superoxide dismutase [Cronobacter dublinensis]ELQ6214874.1 superoxide dismutase [Cronobacter dublinensis]NCH58613.1 superoxide dismutase [Cronobacter dublinensis]
MRVLCLDIPAPGATLENYAPYLTSEALHAWGLYKSGFIRDIYFRQDRPGVAIFLECDSIDEAADVMAEFPLAKAGLLKFECIPVGAFMNWEMLFSPEFKHQRES